MNICIKQGTISNLLYMLQKPTIMSKELKSTLCPSVNDSLMHCPRTSTAWL